QLVGPQLLRHLSIGGLGKLPGGPSVLHSLTVLRAAVGALRALELGIGLVDPPLHVARVHLTVGVSQVALDQVDKVGRLGNLRARAIRGCLATSQVARPYAGASEVAAPVAPHTDTGLARGRVAGSGWVRSRRGR